MTSLSAEQIQIRKELIDIIWNVANIRVDNEEISLFGSEYNIHSELFVYILIIASERFNFAINSQFLESLHNCSFGKLLESIFKHK